MRRNNIELGPGRSRSLEILCLDGVLVTDDGPKKDSVHGGSSGPQPQPAGA